VLGNGSKTAEHNSEAGKMSYFRPKKVPRKKSLVVLELRCYSLKLLAIVTIHT